MNMARYLIDKSASRFTVRAFASGMLSALGHNPTIAIRDFSGEASFVPKAPSEDSLRLEIRAGSLEVTNDISGRDRREIERTMNQEVLEVEKYPSISYQSSSVSASPVADNMYRASIAGTLHLHGVAQREPIQAQITVSGDTLRASGEFSLSQSDYGIRLVSVAGGTLKLKDELKFSFEIVAREQG